MRRYNAIPPELCIRRQWVLVAPDKRPLALMGGAASTTDAATWGEFRNASISKSIGFVFTEDDPFVGIDLDQCMEQGRPCAEARVILRHIQSYTERSPSGTGLHIIGYGVLPGTGRRARPRGFKELEVYDRARCFTMTGQHYPGTPHDLRELDLRWLWRRYFDAPPRILSPSDAVDGNDEQILAVAMRDPEFARLWGGYRGGDWSRADAALMLRLAGLTGGDAGRMERLFAQSGLAQRDKWRGRPDYRERTVAYALGVTCGR